MVHSEIERLFQNNLPGKYSAMFSPDHKRVSSDEETDSFKYLVYWCPSPQLSMHVGTG
jgi:hypothetical protein